MFLPPPPLCHGVSSRVLARPLLAEFQAPLLSKETLRASTLQALTASLLFSLAPCLALSKQALEASLLLEASRRPESLLAPSLAPCLALSKQEAVKASALVEASLLPEVLRRASLLLLLLPQGTTTRARLAPSLLAPFLVLLLLNPVTSEALPASALLLEATGDSETGGPPECV